MAEPAVPFDVLDHRAVRRELETEAKTVSNLVPGNGNQLYDQLNTTLKFACAGYGESRADRELYRGQHLSVLVILNVRSNSRRYLYLSADA